MAYQIISGDIKPGVLYKVTGEQTVSYNVVQYAPGEFFRGVRGVKSFSFSGTGIQEINEVAEISGGLIEYQSNSGDSATFIEKTLINAFSIECLLNDAERLFNEKTKIAGFALELIDFPFYSFEVTETRI